MTTREISGGCATEPDTPPGSHPRGEWPLAGTVKPYRRHVLACTGGVGWPARLEDADGLLGALAREARAIRDDPGAAAEPPKLTATDEPSSGTGLDLLVFPEALRCRIEEPTQGRAVLRDGPAEWGRRGILSHPIDGRHVFVCVHAGRDERCGRCGPPVLAAIRGAVAAAGLDDVRVRATSHVGGHKYAGNVLVYPEGVWYGYMRPDDATRLVREHLVEGRLLSDLHRGTMRGGTRFPGAAR